MQIRGGISTFKTRLPHAYEPMVIAPKVVMNLIQSGRHNASAHFDGGEMDGSLVKTLCSS